MTSVRGHGETFRRAAANRNGALEHRVVVGGFFGDRLDDIPMFDDLAVFQLVNIHDGITTRARCRHTVDMLDDVVTVGEDADDVAVCASGDLSRRNAI